MTFKLFKLFLSNLYSFSDFIENFKKGGKAIAKNILFIICGLYLVTVFGALYIMFTYNTYNSLSFMGHTKLYPSIIFLMAFILIFNFGIISVGSSYYAGNGEEQFLSLPLTPKEFFGAKFGASYISDALIGFVLFSIACGYYGYKENLLTSPLFYIGSLITAFALSIFTIAVIYFLLIIILYFVPFFRKRTILNGIASTFIIIMAFGIGFLSGLSGSSSALEEQATEDLMLNGASNALLNLSENLKPINFLASAIEGKILPIIVLLAVILFIIFVFIPVMSKLYIKTFEGASDVKTKKLSKEKMKKVVEQETHKSSIFKAMLLRDIKGVWREPTFFANGPLFVLLFPFIMLIAIVFPFLVNGGVSELQGFISSINTTVNGLDAASLNQVKYFVLFGFIVFTLVNSTLCMVASTSLSREGKGFYTLKALPITNEIIIKAKFIHSLIYIAISTLITTVAFSVIAYITKFPFTFKEIISVILIMWFVVFSVSSLLIIIDMLFDTINPKLNWETPTAAMKQNMNTFFSLLVNLGTLMIFIVIGVLLGLFLKPTFLYMIIIGSIFLVISAICGSAYFKYADKKISNM